MKGDLTVKKMLEALKLINGTWPREKQWHVGPNWFNCDSKCTTLNYEAHDQIRALGFEDVEISAADSDFRFKFIWKVEKENK